MAVASSHDALPARIAQLEAELAEVTHERTMLRRVLDTLPAVVLQVALDGTIEYVNQVLPEYALRPPVGQSIYSYAPADQHEVMRAAIDAAVRTGLNTSFEAVAQAPDGTRDWYHTIVAPVRRGGDVVGVTLSCSNVTRLKTAELALRESRAQIALALDAGNVGVWRWDRRSDHVVWDDKLCSMFGVAPADAPTTAEGFLALTSDDQRDAMRAHIEASVATGIYLDFELRVDAPDGVRWFVIKGGATRDELGEVAGLLGGVVDVTERRRLMDQVRQAQKLDAMGQLAAGIAHNFNNMLAGIIPVLELAEREARAELATFLQEARQSALRAAELVKGLMLVGRKDPGGAPRPRESLATVITRAIALCRRTFGPGIRLEVGPLELAQAVLVEGPQMEQAVLNVLLNARDALVATDPQNALIDVSLAPAAPNVAHAGPHGSLELRIRDTGAGMDEALRARVFEPFFTTKAVGAGTGLGLATAWATVHAHGGSLSCESTPGLGTVFSFCLPRTTPIDGDVAPAARLDVASGAGACVLIIDDDVSVQRTTAASLASAGYRVVTASSGTEGVHAYVEHGVDVVLLDYSMPGQGPQTTLAQLRRLRPSVPVILYSGLAVHLNGASAHLSKPATVDQLAEAVRKVLRPRRV